MERFGGGVALGSVEGQGTCVHLTFKRVPENRV
jgi:signal transduction histidine kinase